jgi:hypothetical protein
LQTSDHYQEQAVRCLRLAQAIEYPDSKALLLEMAQAWVKLAEQAREREQQQTDLSDPLFVRPLLARSGLAGLDQRNNVLD